MQGVESSSQVLKRGLLFEVNIGPICTSRGLGNPATDKMSLRRQDFNAVPVVLGVGVFEYGVVDIEVVDNVVVEYGLVDVGNVVVVMLGAGS